MIDGVGNHSLDLRPSPLCVIATTRQSGVPLPIHHSGKARGLIRYHAWEDVGDCLSPVLMCFVGDAQRLEW